MFVLALIAANSAEAKQEVDPDADKHTSCKTTRVIKERTTLQSIAFSVVKFMGDLNASAATFYDRSMNKARQGEGDSGRNRGVER